MQICEDIKITQYTNSFSLLEDLRKTVKSTTLKNRMQKLGILLGAPP